MATVHAIKMHSLSCSERPGKLLFFHSQKLHGKTHTEAHPQTHLPTHPNRHTLKGMGELTTRAKC